MNPIKQMLDVSTGHAPNPYPEFGAVRWSEHDYGWIVYVMDDPDWDRVPEWLVPLYKFAIEHGCILISFDQDAEVYEDFQYWEW